MEMQEKMPSPSSQSPRQLAGTNRCLFCVVVVLLLLSSGMAIGLVFVLTRSATLKQPQAQPPPEDQVSGSVQSSFSKRSCTGAFVGMFIIIVVV